VKRLADLGFSILATAGTASVLERNGIPCEVVRKHFEGADNIVDKIAAGEVDLVVNTPVGHSGPRIDGYEIRAACLDVGVPCVTTVQGAAAAVQAIEAAMRGEVAVTPLQTFHARLAAARHQGTEAARAPAPVAVAGS
jgi:carbamoyl-phosphate synthase large subunit